MARATIEGLEKRFGDVAVLHAFSLTAEDGELVTVLGPSGCGKSTLLRLIAGLEEPSAGTIALDGRRIDHLPPHERDVAMVFQSYALYPHMTVRANIEFPLRMRGVGRDERRKQAEEVAELLELGALLDRKPGALSGGQRQRVALARALVRRPALFLLDEPLSNLDARLRESVRRYIRDVQRRLGVTTLYVTHDQTEAMTLGDRVVVLERGRVQQCDTPVEVYERPANAFVAGFVGTPPMNLLRARYEDGVLTLGDLRLTLDEATRRALARAGERELLVGVRPEAFVACDDASTREGADGAMLVATVDPASREWLGGETLLRASLGGETVTARLFGALPAAPARVAAPLGALHFFAALDGRRLAPQ
ncbi:MAG TPA: ABC transporter ATP-binding protein [Candidatus Binatia bacterium]